MRVAVVGGTGAIGAPTAAALAARGAEVLVLSRSEPAALPAGASHRRVDLASGEGLAAALVGVEALVDASQSRQDPEQVLGAGTERLLAAEREAGVGHHVGISIVGCDRVPMSYYGVKVRQEEAIAAGPVPWSVLRATQFHSLLDWLFPGAARRLVLPTGSAQLQPVDEAAVAEVLADAVHGDPAGRLPEVAGPEVRSLTELAHAGRRPRGRPPLPLRLPMLGRTGRAVRGGALCDPGAR